MKLLLFLTLCSISMAQTLQIPVIKFSPRSYICYHTDKPLKIDGKLNEPAWTKAKWTEDFVDIMGPSKPAPRFRTRVKMLWDDKYLYVGAELQEPDIWATLRQRDTVIFRDNDFEVFIDPDGDTHRYCEFEMNALNTVWDLLLIKPYRDIDKAAVNGWDYHGLKTAVSIDGTLNHPGDKDKKWTVEIAFPLKDFGEIAEVNIPPQNNDQWRINFSRVEWKTEVKNGRYKKVLDKETGKPLPEDNWVWSPQGVVNMHYPEMWGYIQFSTEEVGGKNVTFIRRKEEAAKWYLRLIYYHERNYYAEKGKYTDDLKKLGLETKPVPGFKMPPKIECTTDYFEAFLESTGGSERVCIQNDGLTWTVHGSK